MFVLDWLAIYLFRNKHAMPTKLKSYTVVELTAKTH